MKKFLLPLFAFALAIGASAFTTRQPAKSKTFQPALFWYTISAGKLVGPINSTPADKDAEMAVYTECDDSDTPECLLGTENDDDADRPVSIVDPNSDFHIRKSLNP